MKYFNLIALNLLVIFAIITPLLFGGQYEWFSKAFLYTIIILSLLSVFGTYEKKAAKLRGKNNKIMTPLYSIMNRAIDLIILVGFVYMGYKALFIMYILYVIFSIALYHQKDKEAAKIQKIYEGTTPDKCGIAEMYGDDISGLRKDLEDFRKKVKK